MGRLLSLFAAQILDHFVDLDLQKWARERVNRVRFSFLPPSQSRFVQLNGTIVVECETQPYNFKGCLDAGRTKDELSEP